MNWQDQIRQSLLERDQREQAFSPLIAHYHRLAQQTVTLKDRNHALLAAASSARAHGGTGSSGGGGGGADPVQAALLSSLEAQLASTRSDLSDQYKLQSQNAQRLLSLTDSLREAEERGREEREELRRLRTEVEGLRERQRWHREIVEEKEKQLLILQDDHSSLTLELSQLELQNADLRTDNASLLQRWLESKAEEVQRMNEANQWAEEKRREREREKERERERGLKEAVAGVGEGEGEKEEDKA
ncbi:hypothetical protein JCM11251_002106 [Rhodosporidiobolus azoricus]